MDYPLKLRFGKNPAEPEMHLANKNFVYRMVQAAGKRGAMLV